VFRSANEDTSSSLHLVVVEFDSTNHLNILYIFVIIPPPSTSAAAGVWGRRHAVFCKALFCGSGLRSLSSKRCSTASRSILYRYFMLVLVSESYEFSFGCHASDYGSKCHDQSLLPAYYLSSVIWKQISVVLFLWNYIMRAKWVQCINTMLASLILPLWI
jgi:hypothetical protein